MSTLHVGHLIPHRATVIVMGILVEIIYGRLSSLNIVGNVIRVLLYRFLEVSISIQVQENSNHKPAIAVAVPTPHPHLYLCATNMFTRRDMDGNGARYHVPC